MERILDCGERESYWYFIYIVDCNGVERDHRVRRKKGRPGRGTQIIQKKRRLIRGFELGETERVAVAKIGYYEK